jgi:hypothetical protein
MAVMPGSSEIIWAFAAFSGLAAVKARAGRATNGPCGACD